MANLKINTQKYLIKQLLNQGTISKGRGQGYGLGAAVALPQQVGADISFNIEIPE